MSTPVWPATLPQNMLMRGYAEASKDNVIASQNDIGPDKLRRRATAAVRPVAGSVVLDDDQLEILRDFIADTIGDGALAFTFPAQSESGTWLVRLREPVGIAPFGLRWQVTLALEILP